MGSRLKRLESVISEAKIIKNIVVTKPIKTRNIQSMIRDRGITYFNIKDLTKENVYYFYDDLYSMFKSKDGFDTPTKEKVEKSIIWQQDNGFGRITYKFGGDAISGGYHESSLVYYGINNQGYDSDILIIKKLALDYESVIIDYEELVKLIEKNFKNELNSEKRIVSSVKSWLVGSFKIEYKKGLSIDKIKDIWLNSDIVDNYGVFKIKEILKNLKKDFTDRNVITFIDLLIVNL